MTCKACEERRLKLVEAILEFKMAEALKQAVVGVVEVVRGPVR